MYATTMPEMGRPATTGPALGNVTNIPAIKHILTDRPCSSTESQQTCSRLQQGSKTVDQACSSGRSHPSRQQDVPQLQQSTTHHIKRKHALAGRQQTAAETATANISCSAAYASNHGQSLQRAPANPDDVQQHSQRQVEPTQLKDAFSVQAIMQYALQCSMGELTLILTQLSESQLLELQDMLQQQQQQKHDGQIVPQQAATQMQHHASMCFSGQAPAQAPSLITAAAATACTLDGSKLSDSEMPQQPITSAVFDGSGQQHSTATEDACTASIPHTSLRARFERLTAEQQAVILLELEQLEEIEQGRRLKRARRQAAAAARAETASAVQQRRSTRHSNSDEAPVTIQCPQQGTPAAAAPPTDATAGHVAVDDADTHHAAAAAGCAKKPDRGHIVSHSSGKWARCGGASTGALLQHADSSDHCATDDEPLADNWALDECTTVDVTTY